MKDLHRQQMLRKWKEKGGEKDRWKDYIKRDLERVGVKRRTTVKDRRSWRLLIENAVREK